MPSLKSLNQAAGTNFKRWSEVAPALREGRQAIQQLRPAEGDGMLKLSNWKEDYSWEGTQAAIKAGYILDPVPDGWVSVRSIAEEFGGRRAVPWLLGSGERAAQIVWDSGVYDRCRMDMGFELYCTEADAKVLRDYAEPRWQAAEDSRRRH